MSLIISQFNELSKIQEIILQLVDSDISNQSSNQDFQALIKDYFINNISKFKLFLHFLLSLCINHHRNVNFSHQFDQILQFIANEIKNKNDSSLQSTFNDISKEIHKYINQSPTENEDKIESKVAQFIHNHSTSEFISLIEKSNFSINSKIEVLQAAKKTSMTLIEYSAFCGSKEIFQYLHQKNANIESINNLWLNAIHGRNLEIIHLLEENQNKPKNENDFINFEKEAIKCIHNEIADYIFNAFIKNYSNEILVESIQSYNFQYIVKILEKCTNMNVSSFLSLFCVNCYEPIVEFLCNQESVDINFKNENFKFFLF